MELAFLTPLLKNGAKSISGGVAINDERFFKTWLTEDGSGANSVHKSIEGRFMFVIPVELAPSSAKGDECVDVKALAGLSALMRA